MNLQRLTEVAGGVVRRVCWQLFRICPVKKNKIAVVSFFGRGYSDNPKYITDVLLRDPDLAGKLDIRWMTKKGEETSLPDGVRAVRFGSVAYVYHMSTAKIWIDNARKYYTVKKKNQYYMQTWHGAFGLKKIEADAADTLPAGYLRMAQRDARFTDVMLSNSKTLTKLYREAFWFPQGEIIENGLPRNDILFSATEADRRRTRREIGVKEDRRICLYAPTFRNDGGLGAYDLDYPRLAKALAGRFGGEWTVLLRLHPNVAKAAGGLAADGKTVVDVSAFPDIQRLYTVSDAVVTDYSSVMFDFMQTGRPVLLYASDLESYRKERDFFIPPDSLPFPMAQDNDGMEALIAAFDPEAEQKKTAAFIEKHGFCDSGHAAETAAAWIKEKL
ncbi:MAG: CDP-glycerol glycerophosphotransferase family protein [Clostridia bacterium]|nr:CDP-glycerol glycerophosphotransferase family protein [Clostridia bacterium]